MNIEFTVFNEEDDYKSINQRKWVIDKDIHYGVFGEFFFHISSNKDFPMYLQDYSIINPVCFKFCDKNYTRCIYLFLDQKWLKNELKLPIDEVALVAPYLCKEWSKDKHIISNKFNILWEQLSLSTSNILFFRAFIYDLIYRVIDEIENSINVCQENEYYRKEKRKIEQVVERVIQNVHLPIPKLEQFAQEVGMSVSKFKVLFKKIYGQSPYQYLLEHKLVYARKMYQTGEYTLSQIALKIGYSHISGFTKIYKKRFNER